MIGKIKMALTELEQKDIDSARKTAVEAVAHGDTFVYMFAWFWSVVSALYFFGVTFIPMPAQAAHFADIILGFLLGTAVATIIGFFFGNSDKKQST
jgi:uncharacterized membrane protein